MFKKDTVSVQLSPSFPALLSRLSYKEHKHSVPHLLTNSKLVEGTRIYGLIFYAHLRFMAIISGLFGC